MKIAEVSELLDISADTLRYYERIGLIPKIHRDKSGNREHTAGIRKELLLEQREHLQDKIDELQQMLLYLNGKIDKYDEVIMKTEKELRNEY